VSVVTKPRTYACALCGKRDVSERMVFSSFTHNRYCPDTKACDRRRRKGTK